MPIPLATLKTSQFPRYVYYELDDFHMLSDDGKYTDENRLKMHKKRLEVIEELFNNVEIDIIAWCIDNVCI